MSYYYCSLIRSLFIHSLSDVCMACKALFALWTLLKPCWCSANWRCSVSVPNTSFVINLANGDKNDLEDFHDDWVYAPKPHGEQQNSIQRTSRSFHISSFIRQCFLSPEYSLPASVLQLILLMAGVEPNPGPQIWLCSVFGNRITNNIPSVKCNQSSNLCISNYTTLKSHRERTEDFIADCCREQQGQRAVWICTVCNMPIHKNIISVQCSNCEGWCHKRRCSGLVNHKARPANFIAHAVHNQHKLVRMTILVHFR